MVLEKTLESPLDCKEVQPVHPKGDQSWGDLPLLQMGGQELRSWACSLGPGKSPGLTRETVPSPLGHQGLGVPTPRGTQCSHTDWKVWPSWVSRGLWEKKSWGVFFPPPAPPGLS